MHKILGKDGNRKLLAHQRPLLLPLNNCATFQKILYRILVKKFLAVSLFITLFSWPAYAAENQFQLNGFWLHQYKKAISPSLGKPFQTGKTDYSTWEAYALSSKSYMVFEFLKDKPHWIYSIQITGAATEMIPFMGLKLGDDESQVIATLGKPDKVKRVEDYKVNLYEYKDKNYTLEINDQRKIYSLRITEYNELFKTVSRDSPDWKAFKKAILNKDLRGISEFFRPDAEIYINDEVLAIDKPFHSFFSYPAGKFYAALLKGERSVFKELQSTEPEAEIRLIENFGVGLVYKFYKGVILEEIVFFPYAGKYRVYEIKFRKKQ